jgi:hypothetical protein
MDINGARRGVTSAEAVLQLRALHANCRFDAYWTHHSQGNHGRSLTLPLKNCTPKITVPRVYASNRPAPVLAAQPFFQT